MDEQYTINEIILDANQHTVQPYPSIEEKIAMAANLIDRLMDTINELDDGYYSSADEILYADRWLALIDNEIEEDSLDNDIKNLRLFTKNV